MLDADLADVYGVPTKRLNEQVKRNQTRFPDDFMFRLTVAEAKAILASRSQSATLNRGHNIKYCPYVFTEHGAVMLASVLKTPTAVHASVSIARAFIRLREIVATHKELAGKLSELERRVEGHDAEIHRIFDAIRQLIAPPKDKPRQIGFKPE